MKMQDLMLKFPHLPEKIFQKLDSASLFNCREVSNSWQNIIDGRNYPWLCLVNIPTILPMGYTYLHFAAANGQIEAFKTALNEEENKNIENEFGETFLHLACKWGCLNIVELTLNNTDFYIDIIAKSRYGDTALHYACIEGYSGIVKIFMEAAAVSSIDHCK